MSFTEHITSEELAEHRRKMRAWLQACRWLTSFMLLAGISASTCVLFGLSGWARVGVGLMIGLNLAWGWVGWRIDREQRRVMLALQADIDDLRRQCDEKLGTTE